MNEMSKKATSDRTRRRGKVNVDKVTLAHGAGGKAMRDLIDDAFLDAFGEPDDGVLEDQARLLMSDLSAQGDRLALTTDSFVVDPLFFPGGNIGTLAVAGTVNDLAVSGAKPLYLTCGMIIEEGLPVETLRRVARSMQETAEKAGVRIITGDTKVVHHGAADKLFINTAGIGVIPEGLDISSANAKPGDVVIVNGVLGDHGAAILNARGDLALEADIESDCGPLNGLIDAIINICPEVRSIRDATRGGIASVLNEVAEDSRVGVLLNEQSIPMRAEVTGVCEILGLDPLYLANEGKIVVVVPGDMSDAVLQAMRTHEDGQDSVVIGKICEAPAGTVVMETLFGGRRVVDMLVGEQLPRIC
ncbi:MAG TPA: hydrogenase expression/formation protein HypE [Rhodospirillaceae bacterium]|nr:hydrogenase expression/formation protein HypE [Magnetovibrio sp.]HCS70012.1 hydrogenase expression/formation protein HypE [Rhodospirillaceae bacterium]|tara:strand:- start:47 stop:1126 length:1080 start_codon:yes stop_codon:yes gene_type:complete